MWRKKQIEKQNQQQQQTMAVGASTNNTPTLTKDTLNSPTKLQDPVTSKNQIQENIQNQLTIIDNEKHIVLEDEIGTKSNRFAIQFDSTPNTPAVLPITTRSISMTDSVLITTRNSNSSQSLSQMMAFSPSNDNNEKNETVLEERWTNNNEDIPMNLKINTRLKQMENCQSVPTPSLSPFISPNTPSSSASCLTSLNNTPLSSTNPTNNGGYFLYVHSDLFFPNFNNLLNFQLKFSTQIVTRTQKIQIQNTFLKEGEELKKKKGFLLEENLTNFTNYLFNVNVPLEYPSKGMHVELMGIEGRGILAMSASSPNAVSPNNNHSMMNVFAIGPNIVNNQSNHIINNLQYSVVLNQLPQMNFSNEFITIHEIIKKLRKLIFEAEKLNFENQQQDVLEMMLYKESIEDYIETVQQLENQYFIKDYDPIVIEDKNVIDRRHNYVLRTCKLNNQMYTVRTILFSKQDQLESMRREALLLCTLKHPSIIEHVGYGLRESKYQFKMLMEYCKYGSVYEILFKQLLKRKVTKEMLELREKLKNIEIIYRIAISAAQALSYLHNEKKMIGVNLNSSSIYLSNDFKAKFLVDTTTCYICNDDQQLSSNNHSGCVGPINNVNNNNNGSDRNNLLIIPPNLIKYYNVNISSSEISVLTQYKAPEQIELPKKNHLLTSAIDIYAFGIFLYELFTHRNPWKGVNVLQIGERVSNNERPELQLDYIIVPQKEEMKELIEQCWDQDIYKRPTIGEVLNRLQCLSQQYDRNI
ncbi:hypothetical protein ABK040_014768 [Willaertia magna]